MTAAVVVTPQYAVIVLGGGASSEHGAGAPEVGSGYEEVA
jgi:hypothetical protein